MTHYTVLLVVAVCQIPGPADYYPQLPRGPGGKFNKSKPKSTLEWVIYHAKDAPAPTDYKPAP